MKQRLSYIEKRLLEIDNKFHHLHWDGTVLPCLGFCVSTVMLVVSSSDFLGRFISTCDFVDEEELKKATTSTEVHDAAPTPLSDAALADKVVFSGAQWWKYVLGFVIRGVLVLVMCVFLVMLLLQVVLVKLGLKREIVKLKVERERIYGTKSWAAGEKYAVLQTKVIKDE